MHPDDRESHASDSLLCFLTTVRHTLAKHQAKSFCKTEHQASGVGGRRRENTRKLPAFFGSLSFFLDTLRARPVLATPRVRREKDGGTSTKPLNFFSQHPTLACVQGFPLGQGEFPKRSRFLSQNRDEATYRVDMLL